MKENCDAVRPLLDAWIDGELSGSIGRRVARHVEGCPDCREEAESRRGIDDALSADAKAGDPGDAYFATMADRMSARFDFADAARHWAAPERPPRKRRLEIPRAWVPRFAFGIAGAAVATLAGLLVHDLGQHPVLAPLPRVTDTVMESREPQPPGSSADHPAPPPEPVPARAMPNLAVPSKSRVADSPAPEMAKGPARGESDRPAVLQSDAVSVRTRPTEEASGADAAAGSSSYRAPQKDGTAGEELVADAMAPGRSELLAFFTGLSEGPDDRMSEFSTKRISVLNHEASRGATGLADSPSLGLRRDDARTPADSTWIRQRRDEARALADSALATGTLEDCEIALRAYWAMLHRDGQPLLPTPAARAKALASDRLRIERLLRCASR